MEKQIKKRIRTLDVILAFMFTCIVVFIIVMIDVYLRVGGVPDTLVVSVFAFFGVEAGMCGWIKTTKERLERRLLDGQGFNAADSQFSNHGTGDRGDKEDHKGAVG